MRRYVRTVCAAVIAFCICASLTSAQGDTTEKIKNLGKYLDTDKSYQEADTLGKLKTLAKLRQQKRIGRRNKTLRKTTRKLCREYVQEQGGDDPAARLKAFSSLEQMRRTKKALRRLPFNDGWATPDYVRYLSEHKNYGKAEPEGKLKILKDLGGRDIWSEWADRQAEQESIAYLAGVGTDLTPAEKNLKRLKALAELKSSKMLGWSAMYKGLERTFLTRYLHHNEKYQKGGPKEKLATIADLEEADRITAFSRAYLGTLVVVQMLLADNSFSQADAETQKKRIDKLRTNGLIHMFTRRKVQRLLGGPR